MAMLRAPAAGSSWMSRQGTPGGDSGNAMGLEGFVVGLDAEPGAVGRS